MKVTMFIRRFHSDPDHYQLSYGPFAVTRNLCMELSKFVDLTVVCGGSKTPQKEEIENIKIRRVPIFGSYGDFFTVPYNFFARRNISKSDIYNSQGEIAGPVFKKISGFKITSIKALIEGWILAGKDKFTLSTRLRQYWQKICIKNSNYFITPSNFCKEELINYYNIDESLISIIPNGVDTNLFRPIKEKPLNFTLLFAGGLSQRKGIRVVLEAFERIKKEYSDIKLIITDANNLKYPIRDKNITLKGRTPHTKMLELYNSCTILIHPSVHETFGNAVAEAMACGKPVVTFNTTAMPEIVGNAGVLTEINVESFTSAVLDLLSNSKKRKKLGEAARERITKNFSLDKMVKGYLNLYQKVTKE